MGSCQSREKTIQHIVYLTNNNFTVFDLDALIVETDFTEKELLQLWYRFYQLDTADLGRLNNYQFLQLEELKYTPFRHRLIEALGLKLEAEEDPDQNTEEDGGKHNDQILEKQKYKQGLLKSVLSKYDLPKRGLANWGLISQSRKNLFKKQIDQTQSIIQLNFKNYNLKTMTDAYIDFKQFVKFLAVFSPNASISSKAKFVFKIFDQQNDGMLDKDDLRKGMKLLFEGQDIDDSQIDRISEKIIEECDGKHKGNIDFEDFQLAMYNSDLEKNCTIYF